MFLQFFFCYLFFLKHFKDNINDTVSNQPISKLVRVFANALENGFQFQVDTKNCTWCLIV